jgi:Mn2+/Fe2+ NRAMP family transporter
MYEVAEIQDAHKFLAPLLGTKWAPILFAVALIAGTKLDDNIGWPNYHGRLS